MKHTIRTVIAMIGGLGLSAAAGAAVVTVDPLGRGWVASDGSAVPTPFPGDPADPAIGPTNNYIAGNNEQAQTFRNVFVFDLSSLGSSVTITGAQLKLATGPATRFSTATTTGSPAGSEAYTLFDVSTDLASLQAGTGGTAAFDDLGSGTSYGSRTYTSADTGTTQLITLDAAFLSYANARRGSTVLLGGAVTTLDGSASTPEFLFGTTQGTPASNTELLLTTVAAPEPSALAVAATGSLLVMRRRRR